MKNVIKLAVASIIASSSVAHADWVDDIDDAFAKAGITVTDAMKDEIGGYFTFTSTYQTLLNKTKDATDCFSSGNFLACSSKITALQTAAAAHGTNDDTQLDQEGLEDYLWDDTSGSEGILYTAINDQVDALNTEVDYLLGTSSTDGHAHEIVNFIIDDYLADGSLSEKGGAGLRLLQAAADTDFISTDEYAGHIFVSTTALTTVTSSDTTHSHSSTSQLLGDHATSLGLTTLNNTDVTYSNLEADTVYNDVDADSFDSVENLTIKSDSNTTQVIADLVSASISYTNGAFDFSSDYGSVITDNFGTISGLDNSGATSTMVDLSNVYMSGKTNAIGTDAVNVYGYDDFD